MARRKRPAEQQLPPLVTDDGNLGNYGYVIEARRMIPILLGRWHYAGKLVRVVRYDKPTTDVPPPSISEVYGETASEAISKTVPKVEAWIRKQPDFSDEKE